MKTKIQLASLFALLLACATPAVAYDSEILEAKLHAFLAAVDQEETHQRFWAEDLVYTSSSGRRFGKPEILKGFEEQQAESADQPASPVYSAEDIDIRVYGGMAVVAFKLVATPVEKGAEQEVLRYFNTGTFLKRDGRWVSVAWQATAIPDATIKQ